jgi:GMP synthase (glutamine-hydrolysing)
MIYALYHSETETVGLLGELIKDMGLPFREVHLQVCEGLPRDTSNLTGLILMGGPMNVDEIDKYPFLFEEVRLIEQMITESKPVLGICLGAQLIAKALGSKVYPNKHKELGWHPIELTSEAASDSLFKSAPENLTVLHWHGDTFDLPSDAVHLARSSRCENQAFRWGPVTYGLQFHLEATPSMVRSWVKSKDGAQEVKAAGEDPDKILIKTPQAAKDLLPHAKRIFSNYLNLAFSKLVSVS